MIKQRWEHEVVVKGWGEELIVVNNEFYCGKIMFLKRLHVSSYHCHPIKHETFYCMDGKILLRLEGEEFVLTPGMSVSIEPGRAHSFEGLEDSRFLEFSTHDEPSDSVRFSRSGKVG